MTTAVLTGGLENNYLTGGQTGDLYGGLNGDLTGGYSRKLHKPKHCTLKNKKTGSCLDEDLIRKVARILNKMRKKNHRITEIDTSQPCHVIHDAICKTLHEVQGCDSEACILTIDSIMSKLGKDKSRFIKSFQQVMPKEWMKTKGKTAKAKRRHKKKRRKDLSKKGTSEYVHPEHFPDEVVDENALLSTYEIEGFLKRLREKDPCFYDYGAVPIDFSDCSVSRLCQFNLKEHLENNQTKIGIVFNTDPHDEDGEHWIAGYLDIAQTCIPGVSAFYYFDSYGRKPPAQIKKLVAKIQKQGQECGMPIEYFYNDHQFQKYGSQCGMYAIDFVNQMLSGMSFEDYLNSDVGDQRMKDLRDEYFINPKDL